MVICVVWLLSSLSIVLKLEVLSTSTSSEHLHHTMWHCNRAWRNAHTLVNSYLLSSKFDSQYQFRNALIRQLVEKGAPSRKRKAPQSEAGVQARPVLEDQHNDRCSHKLGYREILHYCSQCRTSPDKRPILGERTANLMDRRPVGKSQHWQKRKKIDMSV
jgi:hypothetical protein